MNSTDKTYQEKEENFNREKNLLTYFNDLFQSIEKDSQNFLTDVLSNFKDSESLYRLQRHSDAFTSIQKLTHKELSQLELDLRKKQQSLMYRQLPMQNKNDQKQKVKNEY
ncbi:hypothetical protein [Streptococcus marimammalium]|uniref:hypothetical protein n=1 Tax=Streptococcus marimammalium TaxID=269666 RepID=UPI00037D73AB|nr:hypothetical protein [Streptococcus marimammalium]